MNVLPGVQKSSGGDGDVTNFVTVEREIEFQFHCLLEETKRNFLITFEYVILTFS